MKKIEAIANEEKINPEKQDFLSAMALEVLKEDISEENLFALECIKRSYAKRGYVNLKFQRILDSYRECIEEYGAGGRAR